MRDRRGNRRINPTSPASGKNVSGDRPEGSNYGEDFSRPRRYVPQSEEGVVEMEGFDLIVSPAGVLPGRGDRSGSPPS